MPVRFVTALLGLTLLLPRPAPCQVPADSLTAGDLVRYAAGPVLVRPAERPRARLLALKPSGLSVIPLDSDRAVEVPLDELRMLEVARGTKDIRGILSVVAGAAGCAAGSAILTARDNGDLGAYVGGCFAGFLVGGTAGWFVGRSIRDPRWLEVELGGAPPGAGAGLSLGVRVRTRVR
ncbi:MAG: hypothetical protein RRA92_05815 [Gemmatimonadota bacterium]|nr:hypothetical protein [Gemmatimonadota bacterium]